MIVWDDGTKKQRIYEMWQDNFHDPVSYADFYFKEVYGKNEVLINQEEDVAKGMLHLNPYLLHVHEQPVRAKYIVGVATDKEYRRQGLAEAACAKLMLECLKRGWYPSWDAHNMASVHLAEKLGYHFDREYTVFEIHGY